MKRRDLVQHLDADGCHLLREVGKHSVYVKPETRKASTVPRHREINEYLVIKICRDLAIAYERAHRETNLHSAFPALPSPSLREERRRSLAGGKACPHSALAPGPQYTPASSCSHLTYPTIFSTSLRRRLGIAGMSPKRQW